MSACIDAICVKHDGVRIAGLDIVLVPDLLGKMNKTPSILNDLVAAYPIRGAGDKIEWARPQWVEGDNAALHAMNSTTGALLSTRTRSIIRRCRPEPVSRMVSRQSTSGCATK